MELYFKRSIEICPEDVAEYIIETIENDDDFITEQIYAYLRDEYDISNENEPVSGDDFDTLIEQVQEILLKLINGD